MLPRLAQNLPMPRLTKDNVLWMRNLIGRNRAPYTKTIIFVPAAKARGVLHQLYLLCFRALKKMNVKMNLNGWPRFSRHADVHLTFGEQPLAKALISPPLDIRATAAQKYRVIRIHEGSIDNQIVHYSETWYNSTIWDDYEDSLSD